MQKMCLVAGSGAVSAQVHVVVVEIWGHYTVDPRKTLGGCEERSTASAAVNSKATPELPVIY